MALPKIEEARSLDDAALAEAIVKVKRELFDLRFQQATGKLEKTHLFKHTRHRLAQLLTVERERQIAASKEQQAATAPTQATASPEGEPEAVATETESTEE